MIIGIGNDLVRIDRIEGVLTRKGGDFEEKCFTEHERQKARSRSGAGLSAVSAVYAKRFAAKEACAKALGTGVSKGVSWQDIAVIEDENGRPFLELSGGAKKRLDAITPNGLSPSIHLSLSDDAPIAQAFVVIEAI